MNAEVDTAQISESLRDEWEQEKASHPYVTWLELALWNTRSQGPHNRPTANPSGIPAPEVQRLERENTALQEKVHALGKSYKRMRIISAILGITLYVLIFTLFF